MCGWMHLCFTRHVSVFRPSSLQNRIWDESHFCTKDKNRSSVHSKSPKKHSSRPRVQTFPSNKCGAIDFLLWDKEIKESSWAFWTNGHWNVVTETFSRCSVDWKCSHEDNKPWKIPFQNIKIKSVKEVLWSSTVSLHVDLMQCPPQCAFIQRLLLHEICCRESQALSQHQMVKGPRAWCQSKHQCYLWHKSYWTVYPGWWSGGAWVFDAFYLSLSVCFFFLELILPAHQLLPLSQLLQHQTPSHCCPHSSSGAPPGQPSSHCWKDCSDGWLLMCVWSLISSACSSEKYSQPDRV